MTDGLSNSTYVGDALDAATLKFAAVQFLYCSPQVRSGLELNESATKVS